MMQHQQQQRPFALLSGHEQAAGAPTIGQQQQPPMQHQLVHQPISQFNNANSNNAYTNCSYQHPMQQQHQQPSYVLGSQYHQYPPIQQQQLAATYPSNSPTFTGGGSNSSTSTSGNQLMISTPNQVHLDQLNVSHFQVNYGCLGQVAQQPKFISQTPAGPSAYSLGPVGPPSQTSSIHQSGLGHQLWPYLTLASSHNHLETNLCTSRPQTALDHYQQQQQQQRSTALSFIQPTASDSNSMLAGSAKRPPPVDNTSCRPARPAVASASAASLASRSPASSGASPQAADSRQTAERGDGGRETAAAAAVAKEDLVDDERRRQRVEGLLKSCLSQLVLASSVPFAYAIILVAFLITIIAATSIITILTLILTLTGYTSAYPITENTFSTSLAIGVVSASFAIALVTFLLVYWRRHCQAAYYYLDEPQDASRATNSPQPSETYDGSEYGSVPVHDWAKHVQKLHADSDIGFSREFEQVATSQKNPALTCEHSNLAENKPKNRYTNIVAYDHTRVVLRPPIGGQKKPGFDYINANFIDGYNKPRAYIGTQGPLVSTFDDYWRMIWEQRVVIIVMITNLQERGRRKCDLYWPKEGTETYGYIQVKLLQEVVMATYTLRTFTVRNLKLKKRAGWERTCYQYHYTNWPDHGVPDHPLPVLSFVRKSAAANPPGAGAIICHCSAGCGRSGTYIVIDAMLKQIRHRQSINVVDFLKHIRTQRNYLVQTEEQYIFIHDALVEAIDSGETEIPSNLIAKYIQLLQTGGGGGLAAAVGPQSKQLNNTCSSNYSLSNGLTVASPVQGGGGGGGGGGNSGDQQQLIVTNSTSQNNLLLAQQQLAPTSGLIAPVGANQKCSVAGSKASSQATTVSRSQSGGQGQWSLLERQYRLVASFKAKDFCVVSALKPCNKTKNRTLNLIPLEAHRVHITPKPGQDGSDYVNATFLMGFNHLREFIVTQHPVHETFSDFWQMVYDHNSQTIVLLTPMAQTPGAGADSAAKDYPQFWPQKEDEVDYGSFKVKLTQESTLMKAESGNMIITRDFIMRSNQDDYELQTRIIHCPGWPERCGPLSAVFDLIQVVQQATQQQASQQQMHDRRHNATSQTVTIGQEHEPQNGGPIVVVDKFGGTEAATFAVLTTLFKQINFEDAVDVYMYAKLAHLRRPGIWCSQDDYLFLYRAMEQYASTLQLQQQQHQHQHQAASTDKQAAAAASLASATAPMLHHQTMTLDRHSGRHKQAGLGAGGLKSSTLSRKHHYNQQLQPQTPVFQPQQQPQQQHLSQSQLQFHKGQQQQQQQKQHLVQVGLVEPVLSSKCPPALVDYNHNTIHPSHHHHHQQQQHQHHLHQQQQQQQMQHFAPGQPQPQHQVQMTKGSPYNSAASIGAGSHQHLLAGQTPGRQRPQ